MLLDEYFYEHLRAATGFIEVQTTEGLQTIVMPNDPQSGEPGFITIEPDCWMLLEAVDEGYDAVNIAATLSQFGMVQSPMFTVPAWTKRHVLQQLDEQAVALLPE